MGGKVGKFFVNVAKVAAKAATSHVLGKIPVLGTPLADKINSMYKKGGRVKAFADGGVVPAEINGKPTQAVNTPAQLIKAIEKFPEQAAQAGLSKDDVKQAVQEAKSGKIETVEPAAPSSSSSIQPAQKRGGRARKPKKAIKSSKDVPDMVQLEPSMAPVKAKGGKVMRIPSVF